MKENANQWPCCLRILWLGVVLSGGSLLFAEETNLTNTNTTAEANAPEVAEAYHSNAVTEVIGGRSGSESPPRNQSRSHDAAMVVFGNSAELKADDEKDAVVVIVGNADVKGRVRDAAVAIFGNVTSSGTVGDAVVAVLGNATISGEVGDAVVSVLGNVELKDGAVVKGDVVAVGGKVIKSPNARVDGEIQSVDFGGVSLPQLGWLKDWFVHCVVKLRPLAPQVAWVWVVAGAFLLFYLLVAAALSRPVQSCVNELTRRPVTSLLLGLLTLPLALIVNLILSLSIVGLIVVIFLLPALFFAGLIGKVALLEYLGDSLRRATGAATAFHPVLALLVGALLLTVLYLIPVLGLVTFAITGLWGLGAAVAAAFSGMRRELPEKPTPPTAAPSGGQAAGFAPAAMPLTSNETSSFAATPSVGPTSSESGAFASPSIPPVAAPVSRVPEALAHPRAGFWERMGAAFLDIVIVSILVGVVSQVSFGFLHRPPFGFLVALAYFAGMWTWKGTTIGGIVLNLKVVRLDNQPVTFAVALVRGLAAAFSAMVFFLGFLWMLWDPEKQGWHDRIAGTVVVRLPRGAPLVML